MSSPETPEKNTEHDALNRLKDKPNMNVAWPAFYTHVIKGKCTKHGDVYLECVHPKPDSKLEELLVTCLKCKYLATQEANK